MGDASMGDASMGDASTGDASMGDTSTGDASSSTKGGDASVSAVISVEPYSHLEGLLVLLERPDTYDVDDPFG